LPGVIRRNSELPIRAPGVFNTSSASADDIFKKLSFDSSDEAADSPNNGWSMNTSPEAEDLTEKTMIDFLNATSSPKADEASCLASGSFDETPNASSVKHVTRYLSREAQSFKQKATVTTNESLVSASQQADE
jgi:hypothetical protein